MVDLGTYEFKDLNTGKITPCNGAVKRGVPGDVVSSGGLASESVWVLCYHR